METVAKPFWASKTIWVNVLAAAGALSLPLFGFDLNAEVQAQIVTVVMGIVNVILRFVTTSSVTG